MLCGPFPYYDEEHNQVTLVLSLLNADEIVMAADTLELDGSSAWGTTCHKIKTLGPHLFGASGTNAGYDLYTYLTANGFQVNPNIEVAANEFYIAAKAAYQALDFPKRKHNETSMMLAGFADDDSDVYILKLPDGGIDRQGPRWASIGLGTLCEFFRNLHDENMNTSQRIQLAHFCVSLTARYSHLVKEPIDVAVLRRDGLRKYTQDELRPFQQRSAALVEQVVPFILRQLNGDQPTR